MLMEKVWLSILFFLFCCPVYGQWALPHISVAHVRTEPRHGAEMSTQALMGNPLRVDSLTANGWAAVTLPDGYTGYIIENSLTLLDDRSLDDWRKSDRVIIVSLHEVCGYADSLKCSPVTDFVAGDIVVFTGAVAHGCSKVLLPDSRECWVDDGYIMSLDELAFTGMDAVLEMAYAQMGVPYLWGGLSTKGMDCSGLTKLAFFSSGIILPRDASQQVSVGLPVGIAELIPGDLVFYGNQSTGRVNHVALYEGKGMVIEAAGRVRRNKVEAAGAVITARRLDVGSLPSVASHPWYYSKNVE